MQTQMNNETSTGPGSITNEFMKAMDEQSKLTLNEKNAVSFTSWGVGDQRVALFTAMVRGMTRDELKIHVRDIMAEAKKRRGNDFIQGCVDACVQAVHARDIDEGKGERDLSYWFLLELYRYLPMSIFGIIELIVKKYGSWLDNNKLSELIDKDYEILIKNTWSKIVSDKNISSESNKHEARNLLRLRDHLDQLYLEQLEADNLAMIDADNGDENDTVEISLASKWCPREGKQYTAQARRLAIKFVQMNGSIDIASLRNAVKKSEKGSLVYKKAEKSLLEAKASAYKQWRKFIVPMNKFLDTVEIHMCDGTWSQIRPNSIPARCLKIKRNAIRNTFSNKSKKRGQTRFPDNFDRVECQEIFDKHAYEAQAQMIQAIKDGDSSKVKKKIHGKNLQIHEIVSEYFNHPSAYLDKNSDGLLIGDLTLECQALDILMNCPGVEKMIPLVDVSGSMGGQPMYNAIGIGWLISRKTIPSMRDRLITFEEEPNWIQSNDEWSLCEFVSNIRNASWGGTTNLEKAMNMVLDVCVINKLPNSIVSQLSLCILTDMQWDSVLGLSSWHGQKSNSLEKANTMISKIRGAFAKAGKKAIGTPYNMPKIIVWNLRGNISNFAADSTCEGVEMLGGWSQALLKLFLAGEELISVSDPDKPKPTPFDTYRKAIDDSRYDDVRDVLSKIGEGPIENWKWVK